MKGNLFVPIVIDGKAIYVPSHVVQKIEVVDGVTQVHVANRDEPLRLNVSNDEILEVLKDHGAVKDIG
jgi:hypothetical protein